MKRWVLFLLTIGIIAGCAKAQTGKKVTPPVRELGQTEKGLLEIGLVNVRSWDDTIRVELAYSTTNNFLSADVYGDLEDCYLQPEAAAKLTNAQRILREVRPGYSLLVLDGVRPRAVQYKMWELVKGTPQQQYVGNPEYGSIHNYGAAVDLTIVDAQGNRLDMGTPFDFFGDLAQPRYEQRFLEEGKLTEEQIRNRRLLREVMNKAGFQGILNEWWHFNAFPKDEIRKRYTIIE